MLACGVGSAQPAAARPLDQHVAPFLVGVARLDDAILRAVERRRGGDLDRA